MKYVIFMKLLNFFIAFYFCGRLQLKEIALFQAKKAKTPLTISEEFWLFYLSQYTALGSSSFVSTAFLFFISSATMLMLISSGPSAPIAKPIGE